MMTKHTLYTLLLALALNIIGYILLAALGVNSTTARYIMYGVVAIIAWILAGRLANRNNAS